MTFENFKANVEAGIAYGVVRGYPDIDVIMSTVDAEEAPSLQAIRLDVIRYDAEFHKDCYSLELVDIWYCETFDYGTCPRNGCGCGCCVDGDICPMSGDNVHRRDS